MVKSPKIIMLYDLVVVFRPSEDNEKIEEKTRAILTKEGFTVTDFENMGKRPLSFPVKKLGDGLYVAATISSETATPKQLYLRFKLEDSILRSIVLKKAKRIQAAADVKPVEKLKE